MQDKFMFYTAKVPVAEFFSLEFLDSVRGGGTVARQKVIEGQ